MRSAMASLNRAGAIIFDLRDNTGGFPDSVSLIASYLGNTQKLFHIWGEIV
jgi:C-terminal processing protease CtpA/Prc